MPKITRWVNTSLHLEPGEYQDHELAIHFAVPKKKIGSVTNRVNAWVVRDSTRNGGPFLMYWKVRWGRGVWQKLVGDEAAITITMQEWKKTLQRHTTHLNRALASCHSRELTTAVRNQVQACYTNLRIATSALVASADSLPASKRNLVLKEFLSPYEKRINRLLEPGGLNE